MVKIASLVAGATSDVIPYSGAVMEGSWKPATEADIARLVEDGKGVVAVLGAKALKTSVPLDNLGKTVLVLTDKALHQAGTYKVPKGEKGYQDERGINSYALADLRGVETEERPVPDWIGRLGWALLIGGLAVLGAGFAHGGGFMIAMALFIGPVWMSVPGVLMIAYGRTDGDTLLKFTVGDSEFAVSCRDYAEDDVAAFRKACAGRLGT